MDDGPKAPAGWYPDGRGGTRYWDGNAWTDYTSDNYWSRSRANRTSDASVPPGGANKEHVVRAFATPLHRKWQTWAIAAVLGLAGLSALGHVDQPTTEPSSDKPTPVLTPAPTSTTMKPSGTPTPTPTRAATHHPARVALMFVTDQKDGDSFVASDGNEYRLGLVNTPELSEPCGPDAARFTRSFLAGGFTADAYSSDRYGRHVAEVFDKTGKSLNVALAKSGYGNDRYLDEFRHENPDLARRLDAAFASADSPSCGRAAPIPLLRQPRPAQQPAGNCMSGYSPCLPIRSDMDCGEIGHPVTVTGSDPYRLDRDGDGVGCD